jgi:hypothetical protein
MRLWRRFLAALAICRNSSRAVAQYSPRSAALHPALLALRFLSHQDIEFFSAHSASRS